MMGVWFLSIAVAQYVAGLVAQVASVETVGGQVTNLQGQPRYLCRRVPDDRLVSIGDRRRAAAPLLPLKKSDAWCRNRMRFALAPRSLWRWRPGAAAPAKTAAAQGARRSGSTQRSLSSTYRPLSGRADGHPQRHRLRWRGRADRQWHGAVRRRHDRRDRRASLAAPAGAVTIDGTGKWVTPGIIDVHSHLGDYPSPGREGHSDGNEATSPSGPKSGPSIAYGRRIRASAARSPMAA